MELAKYKACICEGSAEEAIIDIVRWEFGVPTCSRVPITVEKLQKMSTGIPSINSIRQWALCILFISCSFRQLSINEQSSDRERW